MPPPFTSETSTSKLIEALLPREDRYKELGTGENLQNLTNEFFNTNPELSLLKFGKGMEDAVRGDFQQDVETHSNQKNSVYFDEILKYIMTNVPNDEDSFANSEAFEKKIDNLVFR